MRASSILANSPLWLWNPIWTPLLRDCAPALFKSSHARSQSASVAFCRGIGMLARIICFMPSSFAHAIRSKMQDMGNSPQFAALAIHGPDFDAADPDLGAFRLQLDLAEGVRGV